MNQPTPVPKQPPLVIGLVGGIAAGKSLVADCFRRLDAEVLDADGAAHDVLQEPEVVAATRARWGEDILDSDGRIDRRAVARIVFAPPPAGPRELAFLEQLVHPRVRGRFSKRIAELSRGGSTRAVVVDAPLLLEAGWGSICDRILFVEADEPTRVARSRARGWSEEEFRAREAAQMPLVRKRAKADIVIDNSGSPEQTYEQVEAIWQGL